MRPALMTSFVFAPNAQARERSKATARRFTEALGAPSALDRLKSATLCGLGAIELAKIRWAKLRGGEGVVYQPPSRREFFGRELAANEVTPVVERPETQPERQDTAT